jgi:hypothetical protein
LHACNTRYTLQARIRKHPSSLILRCATDSGEIFGPVVIPMRKQDLLARARTGDFFSYAACCASAF